jgi:hypothetical protein
MLRGRLLSTLLLAAFVAGAASPGRAVPFCLASGAGTGGVCTCALTAGGGPEASGCGMCCAATPPASAPRKTDGVPTLESRPCCEVSYDRTDTSGLQPSDSASDAWQSVLAASRGLPAGAPSLGAALAARCAVPACAGEKGRRPRRAPLFLLKHAFLV